MNIYIRFSYLGGNETQKRDKKAKAHRAPSYMPPQPTKQPTNGMDKQMATNSCRALTDQKV